MLYILSGCKTITSINQEKDFTSIPYLIEENVTFNDLEDPSEPYKYIFFRLYNPDYSNPVYIANVLKSGISVTEITDFDLSHSAINFSLNDDFYGLALVADNPLSPESCTNTESNKYMMKCNPDISEQFTFALKVTEYEYEYAKDFVKFYANHPNLTYAVVQNFNMAAYSIKRKFFTKKNKQTFGNVDYPKTKLKDKKEKSNYYVENNFLCSTFIAYTLINTIPRIREWFDEHEINYRFVNVSDIPYIPGMTPLFYSTWSNYKIAAEYFVESNPEFEEYLNN